MSTPDKLKSVHGTYRMVDGAKVEFADAMDAWVPLAYELLLDTARTYNRWVTYLEVTERVQEVSGIRTRMLIGNWSGKLLERVAKLAVERGEPPLTALCVHQDGTIGAGYRRAPKSIAADPDADVDDLAAEHRLLCYQKYATDLPADGGSATLTPTVAEARTRRRATSAPPRPVCPIHFVELSATGLCGSCE